MTGDRVVGWTALFVAGWVAGNWNAGREALGQGTEARPPVAVTKRCMMPEYPVGRKAARVWAQHRSAASDGVILQ